MNLVANSNTQNLFFKSKKKRDFSDVLNEVQSYLSSKYSALVIDGINNINSSNSHSPCSADCSKTVCRRANWTHF